MNILKKRVENTQKQTRQIAYLREITKLVAVVLLGGSLFFFSVMNATANNSKEFDFPNELSKENLASLQSGGRYQMQFQSLIDSGDVSYWYILVWDTNSGRSKMYYGSETLGKIVAAGSVYNLPSSPL